MTRPALPAVEGLRFEIDGPIAIITIDRPDQANRLDPLWRNHFTRMWQEVRESDAIRVAVITGAGEKHFCTGADVGTLRTDAPGIMLNIPLAEAVRWSSHQNQVWKPVICAVNGLCNGAGLHFVVDADIIVAADTAAFMDTHVNVGQVGAIENIGLARRLPIGSALRMTLQGRNYRMPAARAYALGLVDELTAPGDLMATTLAIARDIAANSPQAVALSKESIWRSQELGYTAALEYGWSLLRLHWSHPDFEEGPRAFAERRDPAWDPDPNARR